MYYQANDYELLYLIKDGNPYAYFTLYNKYEHLIFKIYNHYSKNQSIVFEDFKQECFMCLETAICTYQSKYQCSFYSFFLLIVKRRMSKLFRKTGLLLKEPNMVYGTDDMFNVEVKSSKVLQYVIRNLKFEDDLEKDLFYESLLKGEKIVLIAKKHQVSYMMAWNKQKKNQR